MVLVGMIGATSTRIPGDLIAALALINAYGQAGNHLAGAVFAHGVVTVEADEATLRSQVHQLTIEAHSLAQGLARVSRAWDQTEPAAIERLQIERLRVDRPDETVELRRLPIPSAALALPAPSTDLAADLLAGLARIPRRRRFIRLLPARLVDALAVLGLALALAAVGTAAFWGAWTLVAGAVTR